MDDKKKEPLLFANRAIVQFAKGALDDGRDLTAQDCTLIRVTFRKLGGSWEALALGDSKALGILSQAVKAWVKIQTKQKTS